MSNPGFMVMINELFGDNGKTAEAWAAAQGKRVTAAEMTDKALLLTVDGGVVIEVRDDGQSCCETRYMTTDDDVTHLVGGTMVNIEAREMPSTEDEYGGEHEQMAVKVITDQATVTLVTHNEHNGYYGGFSLSLRLVEPAQ